MKLTFRFPNHPNARTEVEVVGTSVQMTTYGPSGDGTRTTMNHSDANLLASMVQLGAALAKRNEKP